MKNEETGNLTIRIESSLRERIEALRVKRFEKARAVPSIQSLVKEAICALLDKEGI
jgi:hypothetical protein